jgi:hypothetical protein
MGRSRSMAFLDLRVVVRVALVVIVVSGLDNATGLADSDGWENLPPANLQECNSLERAQIVAVPIAHRSEALAKLQDVAIVELATSELQTIVDLPAGTTASIVNQIKNEIARLSEQRRAALESHQGSWSAADQQQLDRLTTTIADPTMSYLRPFLVRAVAKYEGTGQFSGSICGENLVVVHGSLGDSIPPSIHVPVVVFLKKKAMKVYAGWQMAR